MKKMSRIISGAAAILLSLSLIGGMMMTSFADGEEESTETPKGPVYASTDYANKTELFYGQYVERKDEQGNVVKDENGEVVKDWVDSGIMVDQANNDTISFPFPMGYTDGDTVRVKYIVNGKLIGEKYSDKTFVMPFAGADLKIDGAFLGEIGGERIEIQIEKKEPIFLEYKCPKCTTTDKLDKDGNPTGEKYPQYSDTLDKYTHVEGNQYMCPKCKSTFDLAEAGEPDHYERVDGGISIIETDKHAVVGGYVYELTVFSDGRAIKEFSSDKGGIEATIKVGGDAISAAKAENSWASFNVYAYLDQANNYENMGATIDEANGVATFKIKDRGWFFIAADKFGNEILTPEQLKQRIITIVIIAVAVLLVAAAVVAAVVVTIVVIKKKKAAAPEAE